MAKSDGGTINCKVVKGDVGDVFSQFNGRLTYELKYSPGKKWKTKRITLDQENLGKVVIEKIKVIED